MEVQTKTLAETKQFIEVALKGRLDLLNIEAAKAQLRESINLAPAAVLVNLSEVHFIDSAGLSALVSGLRIARENGKDIILAGLNRQAQMVFRLTMLDRVFTIYPSVEIALENFSKQNQA